MTKDITLHSALRDPNEKAKKIRDAGFVPVVLYGPSSDNQVLKVARAELEKAYAQVGESNIFDLQIGKDKSFKAIVKNIERDPIRRNIIHADLYQVDMKKEITAEVPLNFVGESKVVVEDGGTLVKYFNHIEVECLPSDLPDHIDVDISVLKSFEDHIRVADLKVPKGVTLASGEDEIVASVAEAKAEVEPEPAQQQVAATETPNTGNTEKTEDAEK